MPEQRQILLIQDNALNNEVHVYQDDLTEERVQCCIRIVVVKSLRSYNLQIQMGDPGL